MLKSIRFQNFRSLRNVAIEDLTPITVLIGANSSGKTNVIDGLRFLRDMVTSEQPQNPLFAWQRRGALTLGEEGNSFQVEIGTGHLAHRMRYRIEGHESSWDETYLALEDGWRFETQNGQGHYFEPDGKKSELRSTHPPRTALAAWVGAIRYVTQANPSRTKGQYEGAAETDYELLSLRLTALNEAFTLAPAIPRDETHNAYRVADDARGIPVTLDFMRQNHPALYETLQDDLRFLLDHVSRVEAATDERETRVKVYESGHTDREAPTISAGTGRLLAILTAYHALDMRLPELPGLLAIEEPDMAVHPLLLGRFVEWMRAATEREGAPRQFILTTHNPRLLSYFKPEEVRLVRRGEDGYTRIDPIPQHVHDIWLAEDNFDLGEVWITGSLGGS